MPNTDLVAVATDMDMAKDRALLMLEDVIDDFPVRSLLDSRPVRVAVYFPSVRGGIPEFHDLPSVPRVGDTIPGYAEKVTFVREGPDNADGYSHTVHVGPTDAVRFAGAEPTNQVFAKVPLPLGHRGVGEFVLERDADPEFVLVRLQASTASSTKTVGFLWTVRVEDLARHFGDRALRETLETVVSQIQGYAARYPEKVVHLPGGPSIVRSPFSPLYDLGNQPTMPVPDDAQSTADLKALAQIVGPRGLGRKVQAPARSARTTALPSMGNQNRPLTVPTSPSAAKRFRVALSFAGEKRNFVHAVALLLAEKFGKERVLYDKFLRSEFARADLGIYLPDLYNKESDLIVAILCPDYEHKPWTGLEWRAIHAILMEQYRTDQLMLCRFGFATVKGLYPSAGFIELDDMSPGEAVECILERLASNDRLRSRTEAPRTGNTDVLRLGGKTIVVDSIVNGERKVWHEKSDGSREYLGFLIPPPLDSWEQWEVRQPRGGVHPLGGPSLESAVKALVDWWSMPTIKIR